MGRPSGRAPDELRPVRFSRRHTKHAEGSVLVEFGDTQVLCTASVEDSVPPFLRGKLQELGARAVKRAGNGSDNTSAAALRWLGD